MVVVLFVDKVGRKPRYREYAEVHGKYGMADE